MHVDVRMALGVIAVASIGAAATLVASCSGGDTAAGDDGGANADAAPDVYDVCATFTKSGDPCVIQTTKPCFPECEAGGCWCSGPPDAKVWSCTTDLSCLPDSAPFDQDGGGGDAPAESDDAGADVADAGDATEGSDATDASGDVVDAGGDVADGGGDAADGDS